MTRTPAKALAVLGCLAALAGPARAAEISMNERPMLPIVMPQTVWAMPKGKFVFAPRMDQETLAHAIAPKAGG